MADLKWLETLSSTFADASVVGAGGVVKPAWSARQPHWFPPEFGWVFGLTNLMDGDLEIRYVRNVWSLNMMVRSDAFRSVGGFRSTFGKVGSVARPEDTDLCLRMTAAIPNGRWALAPRARVEHDVPADRATLTYFLRRCWQEGVGKRQLLAMLGHGKTVLDSEMQFMNRDVPAALAREARGVLRRRDYHAAARLAVLLFGTATTVAGFAVPNPRQRSSKAAELRQPVPGV
ncbi:hypothetical protein GCM10023320_02950 [Pseudonocardia adelaidensis]|uniref:Glycosyl transferase family 2 n=1 Tax=Pseudonocardia adelaidensis TaxID=648754 RepID=A0ABP9N887_9PSEU